MCGGSFGKDEADVACRQMGYAQAADNDPIIINTKGRKGSRQPRNLPYLVNANCSANETYLVNFVDLVPDGTPDGTPLSEGEVRLCKQNSRPRIADICRNK